jgi:hypothetical protein
MAAKGMILLDEIRGRLAEVFSLKSYKIDHVINYNILTILGCSWSYCIRNYLWSIVGSQC